MTKLIQKEQLAINIQQQNLYGTSPRFKTKITIFKHKKNYLGCTSGKKGYFNGDCKRYGFRLIFIFVIPLYPYYKRSAMLSNFLLLSHPTNSVLIDRVALSFGQTK